MSNIFNKWKDGLAKTSKAKFGQIASLFGATEITDDTFEELEALLVQADLGIETSESILEALCCVLELIDRIEITISASQTVCSVATLKR